LERAKTESGEGKKKRSLPQRTYEKQLTSKDI